MCDYSLEMYQTKPAVAGERYETLRFSSGSVGFATPGDADTAVCMACDTKLELSRIPPYVQQRYDLPETARATFVRIEVGPHHDGLRFENGAELTLQQVGPGVSGVVVDDLVAAGIPDLRRAMAPLETV